MKIFSTFPTVNISKLFLFILCIAKNFIWTTVKAIFSIFLFFCTLRFQIFKKLYVSQILSLQTLYQWKVYLFSFQIMYKSQFRKMYPYDWFCGPGSHIIWKHIYKSKHTYINSWSVCLSVSLVLNRFFYFKGISLYRNWLCKIDLPWKIFTMVKT